MFCSCTMHEPSQQGSQVWTRLILAEVFEVRVCVIKAFIGAMKLSLQEIQRGSAAHNQHSGSTGMEVVLLSPQVVALQTTPEVVRGRLQERMSRFASGEWVAL